MHPDEQPLAGGNATEGVVRLGDTVRKPWSDSSPAVLEYVSHLRAAGIDTPRPLGRDEQGRAITEFIPGTLAMDSPPLTRSELRRVGGMIRAIHDASEGFEATRSFAPPVLPAEDPDVICHHDLTPWNLMIGDRWVFIDWDGTGPSTRSWDLAYSAQAFTLNDAAADPAAAAADLAAFVDGYGADGELRTVLPAMMARRTWAMHDMLEDAHRSGREPWGSMYSDGHGEHWRRAAEFVDRHEDLWTEALRGKRNAQNSSTRRDVRSGPDSDATGARLGDVGARRMVPLSPALGLSPPQGTDGLGDARRP